MVTGHFIPLASADDRREISVCRHGIVHLNWWNMTLRFMPKDFERLTETLTYGKGMAVSFGSWCDGDICLSSRHGPGYVLTVASVSLALDAEDYRSLTSIAQKASRRLKTVLASKMWQEPEPESPQANPLAGLKGTNFSTN